MAHYEDWLEEQASTITAVGNGAVRASRITLELSGQVYGAWPASLSGLSDTVRTAIVRVQEELPRGTHPADLIATDDAGQAVARLPLTIKGTNSAATSPNDGIVAMHRGVTVLVGNLESANSTLQRQLELQGKQAEAYLTQNVQLIDALQGLMSAKSVEQLELARVNANIARWDALFAKVTPMVGPLLEIGAGALLERFGKTAELPEASPPAPPAPPPAPPAPPPAPPPADPQMTDQDPPPLYRSWRVEGDTTVTRDCALCSRLCATPCLPGEAPKRRAKDKAARMGYSRAVPLPTAPDYTSIGMLSSPGETFARVIEGDPAPLDDTLDPRVLCDDRESPEEVCDLAAFDAQPSLGGSKTRRKGTPDRRAPKGGGRGKR